MRRKFNRTQRNYIIVGLCMILVIMGVGYAAFSSQLKISGTSNITSNWNVKITNIQSKVVSGAPTDAETPGYTDTTATFKTRLTSPGDTMQYDVTVSNEGDIDAKLDKINVPESTNPAIGFEVSGIKEGSLLEARQTAILTVTVKYNNVTEQPADLTADLKVTLDYSQAPEGYVEPAQPVTIGGQEVEIVEAGDGLYKDEYEDGKYTYKGANPNNYITFNNETWRIISIDSNGLIKIMKNESIGNMAWDTSQTNNWSRPSSLNKNLNENYLNTISVNKELIVDGMYSIGGITDENTDLLKQIADENSKKWTGPVGLLTASEYLRANSNKKQCENLSLNNRNYSTCNNTNWIYKIVLNNDYDWLWLISYVLNERNIFSISNYNPGQLSAGSPVNIKDVSPVVYLSFDITLIGDGSQGNPFQIAG